MNLRRNRCIELILVILGLTVNYVSCSSNSYPREKRAEKKVDPGEPLFLTPYLTDANNKNEPEKARILEKARNLSKVTFPELPDIVSYAGFFTVHYPGIKDHSSFWYFPAQDDPETAPVVWFLEAPWTDSALIAPLQRNGPFMIEGVGRLKKREESWNKKLNMIHVQTTFDGCGYASWMKLDKTYREGTYQDTVCGALGQFFELFPWLRKNDFFVVGEGWSGWIVTHTCNLIRLYNERAKQDKKINLKGMAVGNPWLNPRGQSDMGDEYLHESGLIDAKGKGLLLAKEKQVLDLLSKRKNNEAFTSLGKMFFSPSATFSNNLTGYKTLFNILEDRSSPNIRNWVDWIVKNTTRRALHVGRSDYYHGSIVWDVRRGWGRGPLSEYDVEQSLKNFRFLIYTGNLDFLCPYRTVENFIHNLNISGITSAERQAWTVDNELAGYIRKGGNLTEVLIRNAGHYPAIDQPKWNRKLIESFIDGSL